MVNFKLSSVHKFIRETREHREQLIGLVERQTVAIEALRSAAEVNSGLMNSLKSDIVRMRKVQENLRMAAMAPILAEVRSSLQKKQLGLLETLVLIRDEKLSYARYGDGEFRLLTRLDHNIRFQKNTPELMASLKTVLSDPAAGLLIGMPNIFGDLHWSTFYADVWDDIRPFIVEGTRFGNSHVTRPIAFQVHGNDAVAAWRSIWEDRFAVIVTGRDSRFDMNPVLFGGLASHEFVFSAPTNAFEDLARVIKEVRTRVPEIVLISLGPAGSVLAHELARHGIQALDIGHLSASYEHVLEGGSFPEDKPVSN